MLLYLEMKILNLYHEDLYIDEEIFNVDQSHKRKVPILDLRKF